jgi:hypothetical protein
MQQLMLLSSPFLCSRGFNPLKVESVANLRSSDCPYLRYEVGRTNSKTRSPASGRCVTRPTTSVAIPQGSAEITALAGRRGSADHGCRESGPVASRPRRHAEGDDAKKQARATKKIRRGTRLWGCKRVARTSHRQDHPTGGSQTRDSPNKPSQFQSTFHPLMISALAAGRSLK